MAGRTRWKTAMTSSNTQGRERFYRRHYAACSECGHQVKHSGSGTFISPFFLPEICKRCGQTFSRYARPSFDEKSPHWVHVVEKVEIIPPIQTHNPLTWFRGSEYKTVETEKYPAF
jgi:predicted amidophosphoribosyltransferase